MENLIERLRLGCPFQPIGDGSENIEPNAKAADDLMGEAAEEIERQRAIIDAAIRILSNDKLPLQSRVNDALSILSR